MLSEGEPGMRRSDAALRVIEAAYAPADSERTWLDGILSELDDLAHRNDAPSTISTLGHSDKYIAYELGIERSSVATHLRRALMKLRFATRRDLVRVFGPLSQLRARVSS
jgi:DNA-binding NarL/FixJ family response regulator